MAFDDHALWQFSLALYGAPGVAPACLDLQDRRGADVNLVLFLAFVALSGRGRVSAAELAACRAAVAPWSDAVVGPLRQVRRALKAGSGVALGDVPAEPAAALRRQVAALELEAEKLTQMTLAARLDGLPVTASDTDRRAAAMANIQDYLGLLPGGESTADSRALAVFGAALPPSV